MKIYDNEHKRVLKEITIFLTPEEAAELASDARDLSENPGKHHHHIASQDGSTEIIVAVYTADNLDPFDPESRGVVLGQIAADSSD
jgi:hypothetical protein